MDVREGSGYPFDANGPRIAVNAMYRAGNSAVSLATPGEVRWRGPNTTQPGALMSGTTVCCSWFATCGQVSRSS